MKGIIFQYLEEFVSKNHGEQTWLDLLDGSDLQTEEGVFVGPGNYPDEDLFAIVTTASNALGAPVNDLLYAFGLFVLQKFSEDFPKYFTQCKTAKEFLQSIHCVIHVEVKRLFTDAETPDFEYEDPDQEQLVMHYYSKRKLCVFLQGLLDGVAKHYGITIHRNETQCIHTGADHCSFELTFAQ